MSDEVFFNVHGILAKPIAIFKYDVTSDLQDFLTNQKARDTLEDPYYGGVSDNVMLLSEPELKDLKEKIVKASTEFSRDVMGFDVEEMVDVCSWVSIKRPNQHHTSHYHPNSLISGVFFFDDHTEDMPLIFEEQAVTVNEFIMRPKMIYGANVPFPHTKVAPISVKKGDVVLFPSYLRHFVMTNTSPFNRYSFAFNLMPRNEIGDRGTLTYFNYKDGV